MRNSALDARNEFDVVNSIAEFRRNQFGASAGGALLRDRTFLFGDYSTVADAYEGKLNAI